jgi:pathogenesis-related protein 1
MRWLAALLLVVISQGAQAQYPWGYAPYRARESLARAMLDAHNAIRARVGVPPLVWSPQLAAAAQEWVNHLIATHRFEHNTFDRYGENLYAISGGVASPDEVVGAWAEEARGYDIRTNSCTGVCGHYTQLVWRTTRAAGCAVASDAYRQVWMCDYDPPGNIVGERPY